MIEDEIFSAEEVLSFEEAEQVAYIVQLVEQQKTKQERQKKNK